MTQFGFDPQALIQQFADASARQGEALRKAVQDATLKALQGRELTLNNIKSTLQQVSTAAAQGALKNPMGAEQIEPLLAKAIAGMDAALLQAVEANRRALQQLLQYGADLRENQLKKAMTDIEQMEETFFATVRKSVTGNAGPLQQAWSGVLDRSMLKGTGTGAKAEQAIEELTSQAQSAMKQGRAMGMHVAQSMLDSYAALASGVLIGMSHGLQGKGAGAATAAPAPAAKPAVKKPAAKKAPAKKSTRRR